MDVPLALIADAANISDDGKLNILGVFNRISVRELPATHPQLTLVLKFVADAVEAGQTKRLQIFLSDPDGQRLLTLEAEIEVPGPKDPGKPVELVMPQTIVGLTFERSGPHAFDVLINGEPKARVPADVVLIREDEGE